jgi:conjugal transfer pilus assembly protein TraW
VKKSLVTLFLFCSAGAAAWAAEESENKAPWLFQSPTEQQRIVPMQPAASGTLRDFGISSTSGNKAPWMDEAKKRFQQSVPTAEADPGEMDFDMQVFISTGMPDGVLRHLFKQALEQEPGKIRFVVRGFEPQKLGALLSKLRKLLPDPYSDDVVVEIDPNAFRTYGVTAVPVYLVKDGEKWFEVRGAASLETARKSAKRRGSYTAGELYSIAEPDILTVVEERAKNYDWQPVLDRARSRITKNLKPGFDLPTTSKDATSYVVPTFTAPHDIKSPGRDGKSEITMAKAGQTFNLLDFTRLQAPVIVFDGGDERQVRLVQSWIKRVEFKSADLFVVGTTMESKDGKTLVTTELAKKLKRPVLPMMKRLNERFGVEAVPAIVEQEGTRLRVRYFDPQTNKGK